MRNAYSRLGALVLVLGMAAGCGSVCVSEGDQVVVSLTADADLNDSQHARYAVWAVKRESAAWFEAASAADLLDPAAAERYQALARLLPGSKWITPGTDNEKRFLPIALDEEFTHIGVVVEYANGGKKTLQEIDCETEEDEQTEVPLHDVTFRLGRSGISAGKPAESAKP